MSFRIILFERIKYNIYIYICKFDNTSPYALERPPLYPPHLKIRPKTI